MSIASVRLIPYRLPLRDPWPTAEGTVTVREGLLVALEEESGRVGLGDAAPLPGFGLETLASTGAALRSAARRMVGLPADSYLEGAAGLPHLAAVAATPAARHALDLALHDLASQEAGCSIAALLGRESALAVVPACAVIPRVGPDRAAALARSAVEAGARTLKVKVGGASLSEDLARLRAIRDEAGGEVVVRVDANQAWSEAEALEALAGLAAYQIELAEQPVAAEAVDALARVRRASVIPIAADEAITNMKSARRVLDAEAADILVVKPMVLGGLHAASEVIALARERGVAVVVTSFVESAVGRTGALHLAASLGATPHAHGVATGTALARDVAPAPLMEHGALAVPSGPGLGIVLGPELLRGPAAVEAT